MALFRARMLMRASLSTAAAVLALGGALSPAAYADVPPTPTATAGLGGEAVYDLAVLPSGRVVLGGNFTSAGAYPRTNLAAILANGDADPDFAPTIDGPVQAVVASQDGSVVFIGGTFTEVNGQPRQNLAALDAVTGALLEGWQADTTGALPAVQSLAVSGNTFFVGGRFDGIGGADKAKLAKVDATTGAVIKWNTWVNGAVNEVRVNPKGNTVWIGGEFTKIRGIARPYFGAIDPATGNVRKFNGLGNSSRIITLALSPNGKWVYTANNSNLISAYKTGESSSPRWSRHTDGNTQAIVGSGSTVYVGGHFTEFNDDGTAAQVFVGALDAYTGVLKDWNPVATGSNKGVWTLAIDATHLYAGGGFLRFDGVQQRLFARFDGTP